MTATTLQPGEEGVVTAFGTVTDRRVIYKFKKGWFSGGNQEDIPLRHITSVRLETSRPLVGAILVGLIALVMLITGFSSDGSPIVGLIGLLVLAWAVLLLWGSPLVVINTSGNDKRPASGFPWTRPEAEKFVNALQSQLFKSSPGQ
jgi:hypothetical protein